MTTPASPFSSRLVRAFGGDPDVFFPVARAHALLVRRRAGILRGRKQGLLSKSSPFRLLCIFALLYGVFGVMLVIQAKSRLLGSAFAVTIGCLFLMMITVTDYVDLLVNPREQLILAAHPHDDRSILLAKLWIVGRTLALLFLLLSLPTGIAFLVMEGPAPTAAYLLGAAGAALVASAAGLFLAAAVLTLFGQAAFDRLMPWVQIAFQMSYFVFLGGERILHAMREPSVPPGVAWTFPPLWFLAPFEGVRSRAFTASIAGRTALAVGVTAGVCIGGLRWLGSRIGERLLEPSSRGRSTHGAGSARKRVPRPANAGLARRGVFARFGAVFGSGERRRLFDLLRAHLRSDWRTRSEFLMGPVICAVLFLTSMRQGGAWTGVGLVGWMLLASADVLTRSPRPQLLWFVLVSPVDRSRIALATVTFMRVFQLLPMILIYSWFYLRTSPLRAPDRALALVELVIYGDLLILVGRTLFPEFPFSRLNRADGQVAGRRMVLFLIGGLISGAATGGLFFASTFGRAGNLTAIAALLAARFPVEWWMRRRVTAAAGEIELEAGSAA